MNFEDTFRPPDFAEILRAEKIRIQDRQYISKREMTAAHSRTVIESRLDDFKHAWMISLSTYVHALPLEVIRVHEKWPKDWWQAVKERFAPKWFLRRWPVLYERIDIDQQIYAAVCPHIQDDPQSRHLEWMASKRIP